MAWPPQFNSPSRAFNAIDQRQESTRISVFSDGDLRRAITTVSQRNKSLQDTATSGDGGGFGCEIIICAPIYPTAGYTLNTYCRGLRITSAGRTPIIPGATIDTLFSIQAKAVSIDGLLIEQRTDGYVSTLVATDSSHSAHNLIVRDCIVNANQLLSDQSGKASSVKLLANQVETINASGQALIDSGAFFGTVEGNIFSSADSRNAILLGSTAKAWRITGNHLFAGSVSLDVDTSASIGNNRLAANSGVNTKSLASTDIDDDQALQGASGNTNQIAYWFGVVNPVLSGLTGAASSVLVSDGSSVPSWSTTLPSGARAPGALIRAPQVFTSGTSYAKPDGCRALLVEAIGGGGGGGGAASAASSGSAGAGGSAAGYARKYYDVSALAGPFTYAIGTGGSGGTGSANGSAGNETFFTDGTNTVTATGGNGGTGMAAGTAVAIAAGAAGNSGSGADFLSYGAAGGPGIRLSGSVAGSGFGGAGPFGGGSNGRTTNGNGFSSNGYGSGGGGAVTLSGGGDHTGASGADGCLVIWEFY